MVTRLPLPGQTVPAVPEFSLMVLLCIIQSSFSFVLFFVSATRVGHILKQELPTLLGCLLPFRFCFVFLFGAVVRRAFTMRGICSRVSLAFGPGHMLFHTPLALGSRPPHCFLLSRIGAHFFGSLRGRDLCFLFVFSLFRLFCVLGFSECLHAVFGEVGPPSWVGR